MEDNINYVDKYVEVSRQSQIKVKDKIQRID